MERITKEELLEMLFHDDYEHLKGKKLRMTRVRVPGKEVCLAHVISPSQSCIYENLGLHIGVHEGEDHTGESIGLIRFTPWELQEDCPRCRLLWKRSYVSLTES